ncbi:MAG: hypothetical protein COY80_01785 [Candidatus Pacebacteria bacterium CG_4_10_14_0_8_um_filter_42_14]|nr:MAG: hypothetical protein COY80_01785 [Candidatus Pacebacteria bacterium CG_4_10_14_0_8_um_filter_42_14]
MNIQLPLTINELFLKRFSEGKVVLIEGLGYVYPLLQKAVGAAYPPSINLASVTTNTTDTSSLEIVENFKKLLADATIETAAISFDTELSVDEEMLFSDANNVTIMSVKAVSRTERIGRNVVTLAKVVIPPATTFRIKFSEEVKELVREQVKTYLQFTYPENTNSDGETCEEEAFPTSVKYRSIE